MSVVKVFVVEDELAHATITRLRVESIGYQIVGECDNADLALDAIAKAKPDVVLMDISLPGKNNGITLAKKLFEQDGPPVIFTSSFTDLEIMEEAAESSPASYLVKPVEKDNLKAAITLALAKRAQTSENSKKEVSKTDNETVFVKSGNKLQKVRVKDILWLEAAGDNYCKIVTRTHQLVTRHTLKSMVDDLNSDLFIQTHRAYVVNKTRIDSLHEKEQIISVEGHQIPVGRTFKNHLYEQMLRF